MNMTSNPFPRIVRNDSIMQSMETKRSGGRYIVTHERHEALVRKNSSDIVHNPNERKINCCCQVSFSFLRIYKEKVMIDTIIPATAEKGMILIPNRFTNEANVSTGAIVPKNSLVVVNSFISACHCG